MTSPVAGPEREGPESLGQAVAHGTSWTAGGRALSQVLSILVFILLGRLIQPEAFGIVAMAGIFIGVASALVDFGLGNWLIQRRPLGPNDADIAFWLSLAIALVVSTAVWASAPALAGLMDEPALTPVLRVLTVALPLGSLSVVPAALMARAFKFKELTLRSLAGSVAGMLAAVTAALEGWGVWSLVVQQILGNAVSALAVWWMIKWRPSGSLDKPALRAALGFCAGAVGVSLLAAVWDQLDTFAAGLALDAAALGQYAVGKRVVMAVVGLTSGSIVAVVMPALAHVKHDASRLASAYTRSAVVSLAATSTVLVPIVVTGPVLVPILFGSAWRVAGLVCSLLAVQQILASVVWVDRSALYAVGRTGAELVLTAAAIPTLLLAVWAGARAAGVVGIAGALIIRQLAFWPLRLTAIMRIAKIPIGPVLKLSGRVFGAVAIGVGFGLMVLVVAHPLDSVLCAALAGVASVGLYVVLLRFVVPELLQQLLAIAPAGCGGVARRALRM